MATFRGQVMLARVKAVWLWLLFSLTLLGAAYVVIFDYQPTRPHLVLKRIETNLLALIPSTENNRAAEYAIQHLAQHFSGRMLIGITVPNDTEREKLFAAGQALANTLRNMPSVAKVIAPSDPPQSNQSNLKDGFTAFYRKHQAALTPPDSLARLENASPAMVEDLLLRRLHVPMGAMGLDFRDDPFGFSSTYLLNSPLAHSKLQVEQGWLTTTIEHQGTPHTLLLMVVYLHGSAFDTSLQQALTEWHRQTQDWLAYHLPTAELLTTGAVQYAAAARTQAEHDMDRIGLISLLGIAVLLAWAYRSLGAILMGWLAILVGVAAAALGVSFIDGKLHLLTLVFGASLLGETIDYAIQFFAFRAQAGATWSVTQGMALLRPALRMALLTSLLGYMALALLPIAGIQQIALFAGIGLLVSYTMVTQLLPRWFDYPVKATRSSHEARWLQSGFKRWQASYPSRWIYAFFIMLFVVSWHGLTQLSVEDDIRLLHNPPLALQKQEAILTAATGFTQSQQFFLIEGKTAEVVLEREVSLIQKLKADLLTYQSTFAVDFLATSLFLPPLKSQQAVADRYQHWSQQSLTVQSLEKIGVDRAVIAAWQTQLKQSEPLSITQWLASPLSEPWRYLWLGQPETAAEMRAVEHHASVIIPIIRLQNKEAASHEALAMIKVALQQLQRSSAQQPGVTWVDKPGSVSILFGTLRQQLAYGIVFIIIMVWGVLAWRYGLRAATHLSAPTCLAACLVLAIHGWLDRPISLFSVMGLLLIIGVGVNYAVFSYEGWIRRTAPTREDQRPIILGVWLSALTTLLSFGLLGITATPALQAFGMTLTLGVLFTLCLTPLSMNSLHHD
ncbi:MMPL family transporter [Parvibium lacunae]|uniref:Membrane transport protein MMPL domain-containing protein n=1 Tax=Parvibium lacunae TaxID=1888893 RepID=A0A368L311_9BURK|nr:MMPL family transporter [Parvibium lacunae]RCS57498.1 hypothetical protein DU000_08600 [Parvibium lacunae]